jgi:transposase-like protein
MELETPRHRNAAFEPLIVVKSETRWTGLDDKILSMSARGMGTRHIEAHRKEFCGMDVSPALISTVIDQVQEEVRAWQNRPLEALYPILYLDALYVEMRHNGHVENRAMPAAIGVNMQGAKEVVGLWTTANAQVQLGIVHVVRRCLEFVSWKQRQQGGGRAAAYLHSADRQSSPGGTRRVCRFLGLHASDDCAAMAAQLGTGDAVFRLSS